MRWQQHGHVNSQFKEKVPPIEIPLKHIGTNAGSVNSGISPTRRNPRLREPVLVRYPRCHPNMISRYNKPARALRCRVPECDQNEPLPVGRRRFLCLRVHGPIGLRHEAGRLNLNLDQVPCGRVHTENVCMLQAGASRATPQPSRAITAQTQCSPASLTILVSATLRRTRPAPHRQRISPHAPLIPFARRSIPDLTREPACRHR